MDREGLRVSCSFLDPVVLLSLEYFTYLYSCPLSPISSTVTSASVKSTLADSASVQPCSFTSSLRLRATLSPSLPLFLLQSSCKPSLQPSLSWFSDFESSHILGHGDFLIVSKFSRTPDSSSFLRSGKNDRLFYKGTSGILRIESLHCRPQLLGFT